MALVQWLRARSNPADAEIDEVAHEQVGKVNQSRAATRGIERDNRQGEKDRIGVVLVDGLFERTATRCLVEDVMADDLDSVAHPPKDQYAVIVAYRQASLGQAAGDRNGCEQRLIVLVRANLDVQVIVCLALVKSEQPVDLVGVVGDLAKITEVVVLPATRPSVAGSTDDTLCLDVHWRLWLLPVRRRRSRRAPQPGRSPTPGESCDS